MRVGMVICSEYEANPRVRRQAEALAARGDDVTVLALHCEGRPRREVVDGVRVVHSGTRKYRGDSARSYLALYGGFLVRATAWLLRQPRAFDLVQAHTMPEVVVLAALPQRLAGVPVLLDVHDLTEQLFASKFGAATGRRAAMVLGGLRAGTRLSLRFADEVLTVHEPYAARLRQWTDRPVTVVLNSPDPRLFAPRSFRPWSAGDVVFSYHGLIAPRHGLEHAVEALAKLRQDVPGARMQVIGAGDGLPALRARIDELGLAQIVTLPTHLVPVTAIPAMLQQAHIGVVPSQRDPWTDEVLPTKLLEYAVLGIPVITFRNRVIERYFPPDAVTYVDPASSENLVVAMRTLATEPDVARRQAQRASEVVAGLSWERQKLSYFEVLDRMVVHRRRGGRREPVGIPA
jgi:glycosyltransferase involved in cell wall biosynthesis